VNAEVVGMVVRSSTRTTSVICRVAYVTGLTGLTAGTTYFLTPTSGAMTATEPSTNGQVTKPIFIATSTTAGWFVNFRGLVISTGTSSTQIVTAATNIVNNQTYITNHATTRVELTLPVTAAVGDRVRIVGYGAAGWKLKQNASQLIHDGSVDTTTGTGGSLASISTYDNGEWICVVANTEWVTITKNGSFTRV
jgi:hypothetical protein